MHFLNGRNRWHPMMAPWEIQTIIKLLPLRWKFCASSAISSKQNKIPGICLLCFESLTRWTTRECRFKIFCKTASSYSSKHHGSSLMSTPIFLTMKSSTTCHVLSNLHVGLTRYTRSNILSEFCHSPALLLEKEFCSLLGEMRTKQLAFDIFWPF